MEWNIRSTFASAFENTATVVVWEIAKDRDLLKVYIDREVVQEQTSTLLYSVEDLGRTTVQFLEKNIFGSVLKTDNKRIE